MSEGRANSLQHVILSVFGGASNNAVGEKMAQFSLRDWRRLGSWLHASGLALYLLDALHRRGLGDVIPAPVLGSLEQNQRDNCERTDALIADFIALNSEFMRADLDFLNVKGFSLGAAYCPSPTLRSQFDLDFWVSRDQAGQCQELMHRLGYVTLAKTPHVLECRAGSATYPKLRDFYKPRSQKLVEIHLRDREEMKNTPRANGLVGEFVFPTLPPARMFVEQALHLTKHLRHEWTRASWMLELQNAIRAEGPDAPFWREVQSQADLRGVAALVGVALAATNAVFPATLPAALSSWSADALDERVAQWVERYAMRAVTAQFPGTKLYVLLNEALEEDRGASGRRRQVLVPLRLPDVIKGGKTDVRAVFRYLCVRSAFHVRESGRLLREQRAWRKSRAPSARRIEAAAVSQ